MNRDYWNVARRDFRALGFVVALIVLFFIISLISTGGPIEQLRGSIISAGFLVAISVIYFFISNLFKKRSPKAIMVASVWLGIMVVMAVVNGTFSAPFNIGTLMGALILVYLITVVYKASKQKPA